MYIGDTLGRRAIYSPERLAVVDAGKADRPHYTYRQMNERANRFANWLRDEVGVTKGDRIGIIAHDGVEFLDAFYACGKLGAILACYNWRMHWRELAQVIADTTPKLLIFSDEFRASVERLLPESLSVTHTLHIEGEGVAGSRRFEDALQSGNPAPVVTESVTEEDIVALIFTGGTTGLPKGAQISHRMIGWNTLNTVIHDILPGDTTVNVFPMFHTGGLLVYTAPLMIVGGTAILVRRFDPELVLSLIEEYRADFFAGVPTMYQMLTQAPNWAEADLSSLRFCTSGGAPLPVTLVEQFGREKGVRFKQGFGMTEFGPGIFALAPEDAIRKAGSIGRPNFFVDARVVDEHNRPLPPDTVGELVLKGPSICSGYFNLPGALDEVLDDEGWFHTGDLARYDDEWYFFIVDRKKDMFISGGENIYPTEIEQALYRHPAVHQCAVIGVPDDRWGEIGVACVVLRPGAAATQDELLAFLRDHLAGYKVPKSVAFFDALPISAAGKILKRELRERLAAGGLSDLSK
ncbi:MAG: long-chain fatty acid--CoA ligase [Anaerolineae bacterium]|nr:long-chain fatty acid--CoA ligase [Anaerolineae bacterium]